MTAVAVIWIDWYSYQIARFRALAEHPLFAGSAAGIELVGGAGVHSGLAFRDSSRDGLPIRTLAPDRSWSEAGQKRLGWLTWRELRRLRPATVLVPGYYTIPGIAAALWAKCHGSLSVLMTESGEQDHSRSSVKEWFKGLAIRALFDRATVGGSDHRRYLVKLGFSPDRIGQFYDTVDNAFFGGEAASLRAGAVAPDLPKNYFLYVGRLAPEKNLSTLLRAFAQYREAGGQWSLVLAGDGPLGAELREQASSAGLSEHVVFAGMRTTRELPRYYAFASCFILPSTREPWGLVVNEAMASGLPVLVSNRCGCAADLVETGTNGFVFEPSDEREMARVMGQIGSLPQAQRLRMGLASEERISRFSPRHWAEEVAALAGWGEQSVETAIHPEEVRS